MRSFLIIAALCFATLSFAQKGNKKISLEDIWTKNTFAIKSVQGFNAMQDGLHYTQTDKENKLQQVNVYELATGNKVKTLFDNSFKKYNDSTLNIDEYILSKDEQKMLLLTESKNIYRRSVLHKVYVYDLNTQKIQLLDKEKVLHAAFSPDGKKVAYVKDNNLYYKDLASGRVVAVTRDGKKNHIINGNCDWVYEEEFAFTKAYEWSGDGKYIAYYRFDESKVKEYTLAYYDSLYPRQYTYKYPKAGEDNSVVQIKLYNVASARTINANVGPVKDQYIPRIKWMNNRELCISRLNRRQNKLELLRADAASGNTNVIYDEEDKRYINISDNLEFLPDGNSIIFTSERTGYNHVFCWNWKTKELKELTPGDYDVEAITGVDENKKLVYFTAAEKTPMERKLYSVDWDGTNKKCLTKEKGSHGITACKGNNYFLDRYSTLTTPPVYYLRDASGNIVRTLEDNSKLAEVLSEYALGDTRLMTVKGANGDDLNAWMIRPPNFSSGKQYPVLMFQYSGPGSQQVADKFPIGDFFWHQMLAEKGYIIVCVDGTGTGFRGAEFRKKTYLELGKLESDDQIAAAKYLADLPYVDKDRIGIWGWSYGGFMSSICIMKGNDVFKTAISVAPVTNWRYYDNIYTERYMRKPQENEKGYDENAPEKMASQLKGKLLLIHGTGDDNVHFQNSAMFVNELIKANRDYDSEYYPNRAHGISGGNTRLHLYRRMTAFILENL